MSFQASGEQPQAGGQGRPGGQVRELLAGPVVLGCTAIRFDLRCYNSAKEEAATARQVRRRCPASEPGEARLG